MKKDNKYLIGMELRETERNYVTMLSNIIRVGNSDKHSFLGRWRSWSE